MSYRGMLADCGVRASQVRQVECAEQLARKPVGLKYVLREQSLGRQAKVQQYVDRLKNFLGKDYWLEDDELLSVTKTYDSFVQIGNEKYSKGQLSCLGKNLYRVVISQFLTEFKPVKKRYKFTDPVYYRMQDLSEIGGLNFENMKDFRKLTTRGLINKFVVRNGLDYKVSVTSPLLLSPIYKLRRFPSSNQRMKYQLGLLATGTRRRVLMSRTKYNIVKLKSLGKIRYKKNLDTFYWLVAMIRIKYGMSLVRKYIEEQVLKLKRGILVLRTSDRIRWSWLLK